MKRIFKEIILILISTALLSGCTQQKTSSKIKYENKVEQIIQQQIEQQDQTDITPTITPTPIQKPTDSLTSLDLSQDCIDLTSMTSDMVYATVYQMMMQPEDFEGKKMKMRGNYSGVYYEPTKLTYHYCIIKDALQCCATGIEFVWEDDKVHALEEYPEEGASIVVCGIFETYKEEGDDNLYCHLKNASLEVE